MRLMISEQLKFFLAKYLRSKSGGDYTEIELWIQPNPALAPGSPPQIFGHFHHLIVILFHHTPILKMIIMILSTGKQIHSRWRFFSSFLPPQSGDKFPSASWRVWCHLLRPWYPDSTHGRHARLRPPHFVRIHHLVSSVNRGPAKSPHDTIGI